jgi:hypothetical protein
MPSMLTAVTVSDLLHQLGDIPPERVRLQPAPGTATEADVVAVHDREKRLCELVDGVLVEKTMGYYESYIAATLIRRCDSPRFYAAAQRSLSCLSSVISQDNAQRLRGLL